MLAKYPGNLYPAERTAATLYFVLGQRTSETADYHFTAIRAKSIFTGIAGQVAGIDELKSGIQANLAGAVYGFRRSSGGGIHPIPGKEAADVPGRLRTQVIPDKKGDVL